ncbi:unnamed protein product [Caenorhabditis auriculariae]|uniref:Uncharacterized protein n=1 Tax=Caenorhabditis auriculariae TaxID=2777116 RepID=A0A8S1HXU4_9PELO|nr:unnamed protein product [Caenorhabditis auriculariae]
MTKDGKKRRGVTVRRRRTIQVGGAYCGRGQAASALRRLVRNGQGSFFKPEDLIEKQGEDVEGVGKSSKKDATGRSASGRDAGGTRLLVIFSKHGKTPRYAAGRSASGRDAGGTRLLVIFSKHGKTPKRSFSLFARDVEETVFFLFKERTRIVNNERSLLTLERDQHPLV